MAPDRSARASARAGSGSTVAVTVVRSPLRSMASWCHPAIAPHPTSPNRSSSMAESLSCPTRRGPDGGVPSRSMVAQPIRGGGERWLGRRRSRVARPGRSRRPAAASARAAAGARTVESTYRVDDVVPDLRALPGGRLVARAEEVDAFTTIGASFAGPLRRGGSGPGPPAVGWTPWFDLHHGHGGGPTTDPVWVGDDADGYEVRLPADATEVVLHLVRPTGEPVELASTPAPATEAGNAAPPVQRRSAWGAAPYRGTIRYNDRVTRGVVHHTVNTNGYSAEPGAEHAAVDPGVPPGQPELARHRLQLHRRPLRHHLGGPGPELRPPDPGVGHVGHDRGHRDRGLPRRRQQPGRTVGAAVRSMGRLLGWKLRKHGARARPGPTSSATPRSARRRVPVPPSSARSRPSSASPSRATRRPAPSTTCPGPVPSAGRWTGWPTRGSSPASRTARSGRPGRPVGPTPPSGCGASRASRPARSRSLHRRPRWRARIAGRSSGRRPEGLAAGHHRRPASPRRRLVDPGHAGRRAVALPRRARRPRRPHLRRRRAPGGPGLGRRLRPGPGSGLRRRTGRHPGAGCRRGCSGPDRSPTWARTTSPAGRRTGPGPT